MKPIFTIHGGEFVFGETLLKKDKKLALWVPVKDTGVDFLVTGPNLSKPIAVQVKMSRDYSPNVAVTAAEKARVAGGWFNFNREKLANSKADIWSLLIVSPDKSAHPYFINIPPKELLAKLTATFGERKIYQSYPSIIKRKGVKAACIEERGLDKESLDKLGTTTEHIQRDRDLTRFLDDWSAFAGNPKS